MNNRPKILLVDDEQINLQVMSAALKDEFDLITAQNGFDAIAIIKEQKPDLVLLDVMMPDINGFDVCSCIKAEESFADIPVIFLTALDADDYVIQGLELGGIDYITKPFDIRLLRLRVKNQIELKRRNDLVREQRDLLVVQKKELEASFERIKRLEGIIPICMYCKKIRDADNNWRQLEQYIASHSDANFSHGICPQCEAAKLEEIAELD
jgi:DNA-binding response OmpR family regulator